MERRPPSARVLRALLPAAGAVLLLASGECAVAVKSDHDHDHDCEEDLAAEDPGGGAGVLEVHVLGSNGALVSERLVLGSGR